MRSSETTSQARLDRLISQSVYEGLVRPCSGYLIDFDFFFELLKHYRGYQIAINILFPVGITR